MSERISDTQPTKLKPCPFCGTAARWAAASESEGWEIQCSNAECPVIFIGMDHTGNALEKAWNQRALLAASEQQCAAAWKALGFPDGHDGDLVAAARKLKEDHDSLAETATDADKQLAQAVKERNALGLRAAELEQALDGLRCSLRSPNGAKWIRIDSDELQILLRRADAALATPAPEKQP